MTLEERLALAREIAARTKPRFVVDNSRQEARQRRFDEARRFTEACAPNPESDDKKTLAGMEHRGD
jgi:hypothetical protein